MMQRQDLEWRIANALGSSSYGRASFVWVQPALLVLSLFVLLVAPAGVAAQLTPIVGTVGLGIEFLCLLRLVFRMQFTLLSLERQGLLSGAAQRNRSALRRSMLPAVNAMGGLLIFTLMFYPLSHAVIDSSTNAAAGRLLWLLTVGAAIVALAFGQLVSLLLDAVQQEAVRAEPVDVTG